MKVSANCRIILHLCYTVDDLTNIWNYTFDKWSEKKADRYFRMLLENCSEVATNHELGKNYTLVAENLFGFKAGQHIIFYRRVDEDTIEITRILYEQMDLKNRIKEK
jgi:toxin ParE1/3/4